MVDELENDVKSTAQGEKFNRDLNAALFTKDEEIGNIIAGIKS